MVVTFEKIKIGNYAIYLNGPFPSLFNKKYKGVLIVVDKDEQCTDSKYIHFRLDKGKKDVIFKTRSERLDKIIFNDEELSISCNFDKKEVNESKEVLFFTEDEFEELSDTLPEFLKECGCEFDSVEKEGVLELVFK